MTSELPPPSRAGQRALGVGLIALTGLAAAAIFSIAPPSHPTAARRPYATTTTTSRTTSAPAATAPTTTRATPSSAATAQVAASLAPNAAVATPATAPPPTTPPCPTGSPTLADTTLTSHQDAPPPMGAGLIDGMWHTTVTGKVTNHATASIYVANVSVLLHDPQAGIPVPTGGVTAQSNGQPVPIAPGATVTWSSAGDVVTLARPRVTSVALGFWTWSGAEYADCAPN